jgi:hypothetical protein
MFRNSGECWSISARPSKTKLPKPAPDARACRKQSRRCLFPLSDVFPRCVLWALCDEIFLPVP